MPLNFPSNPALNQTSVQNSRVFVWTGAAWQLAGSGGSGLSWSNVPASATASGTAGQIAYDNNFFYVATASNTWRRCALSTWVTDSYWSQVMLLLHLNGSDGSTVITDTSSFARAVSRTGSAAISTAQSQFDGASLRTGTTSGDGVNITAPAFTLTGDFTIEGWFRPATAGADYYGYSANVLWASDHNGMFLLWSINSTLYLLIGTGSGNLIITSTAQLSVGQWTHVALVRSGSGLTLFMNGSASGTGTYSSAINSGTFARLGQSPAIDGNLNYSFNGWIDEFRVTSAARYTGAFTVPTSPFTES